MFAFEWVFLSFRIILSGQMENQIVTFTLDFLVKLAGVPFPLQKKLPFGGFLVDQIYASFLRQLKNKLIEALIWPQKSWEIVAIPCCVPEIVPNCSENSQYC